MSADAKRIRSDIVAAMQELDRLGLNHGTAGNVSVRYKDGLLVTPSGVVPNRLTPDLIVEIDMSGEFTGSVRPTTEWRMHADLLAARTDVQAVVHCHSRFATTFACSDMPIPALHYMIAATGGASIRVAPYATFGSSELAARIVETLDGRLGCLMANHGQVAIAPTLDMALLIACEIEQQATYYHGALAIGDPKLLSRDNIDAVMQRFATYGQGSELDAD